jgi:3-hydroxyisobutyrate dehydrogenase-like beta-hydroxyacid dehydrogenase
VSETFDADVAVLGCGLMGSALARTIATSGRRVVVWNRTPQKAQALVGPGITAAHSAADAIATSSVVLTCVSTYDDVISILGAAPSVGGRTLVNFGTGTPSQARALAAWCADHDLQFLDAAILAYPRDIGTKAAQILISGPAQVWADLQADLKVLGDLRHVSTDVSGANVLDVGVVGAFYISAVTAFIESATYVNACGISTSSLLETAGPIVELLGHTIQEAARAVESGEYATDQAALAVYAEAARGFLSEIRGDGHRARLLGAAAESLNVAEAAGLGHLGIFAVRSVS